jgi:hypothetical protein
MITIPALPAAPTAAQRTNTMITSAGVTGARDDRRSG